MLCCRSIHPSGIGATQPNHHKLMNTSRFFLLSIICGLPKPKNPFPTRFCSVAPWWQSWSLEPPTSEGKDWDRFVLNMILSRFFRLHWLFANLMLDRFNPEEAKTVGRVRKDLFKDQKSKWLKIWISKNSNCGIFIANKIFEIWNSFSFLFRLFNFRIKPSANVLKDLNI